ncbi:hypothetical protein LACWKB8_1053 [Lactobacillus sp. wkB8]|uniref:hypothetical protein n=1 Tax=Lactobacillus sp. wkB8 TaxID=1545702 RepID=UPI00050D6C27|nr:hypothetical protein [Lactobacillus sp. wkB8]AIS09323.1 hypothetical protein LACWKB8_1053 [Lactobacillus sp. wkB8]
MLYLNLPWLDSRNDGIESFGLYKKYLEFVSGSYFLGADYPVSGWLFAFLVLLIVDSIT